MKIPFASSISRIKGHFSPENALLVWYRYYKVVVFIGFLLTLTLGGWTYYHSLYLYHFSDAEKKQYVDSYFKETTFKETRFKEVVEGLTVRARKHQEPIVLKRNIFDDK